jgi:hypothetical protein
MSLRLVNIGLMLLISFVLADPTMYKKNEQNMYEQGRLLSDCDWSEQRGSKTKQEFSESSENFPLKV